MIVVLQIRGTIRAQNPIKRKNVKKNGPAAVRFIMNSTLPDEPEDVIVNRLGVIRSIEYDWTTGNLYYIDASKRQIIVVKTKDTDGQDYRKAIVKDMTSPSDLVLHPRNG